MQRLTLCLVMMVWFVQLSNGHAAQVWQEHVTKDTLKAGYHHKKKCDIYICKANLWGHQRIGATWLNHNSCIISFDGKVYGVDNYKLLSKQSRYWWPFSGKYPANALSLGDGQHNIVLNACRSHYKGSLLVGKTWQGHPYCDVVFHHELVRLQKFELLI